MTDQIQALTAQFVAAVEPLIQAHARELLAASFGTPMTGEAINVGSAAGEKSVSWEGASKPWSVPVNLSGTRKPADEVARSRKRQVKYLALLRALKAGKGQKRKLARVRKIAAAEGVKAALAYAAEN